MSRWATNFDNQGIKQRVQNVLAELEAVEVEGLSEQYLIEYSRLLKILKVLAARISKLDPELFNLNAWANFPNWLNESQNHIKAFEKSRSIIYLQNANNVLDQIVNVLRPLDTGLEEFESIAEASALFQQKIIGELQRVKERGDEVKNQLNSLSEAITQNKARLDENDQVIQQQKTRLDKSIAEFQQQFSQAQENRTKDFADTIKTNSDSFLKQEKQFEVEFKKATSQQKEEFYVFFNQVREKSDAHLSFLQEREVEVNRIFGAIGTTAFAGNFKTTADSEASSANVWRRIALILMVLMIGVCAYAFYYSIVNNTDWRIFLFRLGTVVVIAVPAFYAANESSKHRERERQNRKTHLELASLDAYLVLLPEAERNKIKGNLTEKFFGVPLLKEKTEEISRKDLFGTISTMLNNLTKRK